MKLLVNIFTVLMVMAQTDLLSRTGHAYPLDGYAHTGIGRLEGLYRVQKGEIPGPKRVAGAQLPLNQVDIRMADVPEFKMPDPDPDLAVRIRSVLGENAAGYTVAVLDLTNKTAPRYATINGQKRANPGSVGKIIVALGIFQALADIYPNDADKRMEILRSTMVTADEFIQYDHHKVPFWNPEKRTLKYRPIKKGDRASLWTFLDWMMSASSNAAAAVVQKELMLLVHFGRAYPVAEDTAGEFLAGQSKKQLSDIFLKSHLDPLVRSGLNPDQFRQGSFFTRYGKNKVPGITSFASPAGLIQFLLKMEQGLLVDEFSSREIKRLLYMTGKRIRYASSPALYRSAVYFKSGSLYKCKPEEGFTCRKYRGNVLNQLASVAIVEQKAPQKRRHYLVAVMSNVLYENSAVAHQTLATRLHRILETDK